MTFGDLFNSATELVFEEKTYRLRQPSIEECGEYQRHLEAEARAGAARATELDEHVRERLLVGVVKEIAAKAFRWGGELCVKSLRTVDGIAKLMSIVCADQGVTEALAMRICERHLRECIAILAGADEDPKAQAAIPALLAGLGLPPTFLSSSSSASATSPTEPPPTSPPSAG